MARTTGPCKVLPDNWKALRLFLALETQWRLSPSGEAEGLDYGAITPLVLRGVGVTGREWPDVFGRLRVVERAALMEMHR